MKLSERCARLREDAVNVKSHSIPVTREWLLHFYKGALAAPALPENASPAQVNARLIAGGDIEASPYRVERDKTAYQYCDFKEACHFDPTLKKDKLRFLPAESPARVYEILEEEQDGKEEQA
jgi:hypothetical protein